MFSNKIPCPDCGSHRAIHNGIVSHLNHTTLRYKCKDCGRSYTKHSKKRKPTTLKQFSRSSNKARALGGFVMCFKENVSPTFYRRYMNEILQLELHQLELPEMQDKRALANKLLIQPRCLYSLKAAFDWSHSPEGYEYWDTLNSLYEPWVKKRVPYGTPLFGERAA